MLNAVGVFLYYAFFISGGIMNYHIRQSIVLIISCLLYSQNYAANRNGCVYAPVCTMPMTPSTKVVTTEQTQSTQITRTTEDDKKKATILAHVAQIVNAISMIAVNPKDRSNVGMQVGNVMGNVIGIAMTAGQKNGTPMDLQAAEQYLKSMDEQTKMKIAALVSTEMTRCIRDKGSKV